VKTLKNYQMTQMRHVDRVARWYIFKPKIQTWVNFGGPGMEKVGTFYGHLEHIQAIWYILWPFGNLVAIWYIFSSFGILCEEKFLATLHVDGNVTQLTLQGDQISL
jgi:hypothetical protein